MNVLVKIMLVLIFGVFPNGMWAQDRPGVNPSNVSTSAVKNNYVGQEFQGINDYVRQYDSRGSEYNTCRTSWKYFHVDSITERDVALAKAWDCRIDRQNEVRAFVRVSLGDLFETLIAENKKSFESFSKTFHLITESFIWEEKFRQFFDLSVTEDESVAKEVKAFRVANPVFSKAYEVFLDGYLKNSEFTKQEFERIHKMYLADVARIEAAYTEHLSGK